MIKSMVSQWSHLVGALLSLPCLLLIILIYCIGFSFIRMPGKCKHSLINILLLITSTITLFTVSLTLPSLSSSSSSLSGNHLGYHSCLISSTLVNFSTLSCLLWMLLSAFSMYQSLTHSAHEISLTINSTSTSSSSNNNNCTKSSTTDDNEDEDEIEPNHEDEDEEDEDDNLKIPPDLPLQSRSQYHHHHHHLHPHHHHQYHPTATLSSGILSGKKSSLQLSSLVTIFSYYLFAYGLSTLICISCLLINTNNNNYNQQQSTHTNGSTIYSATTLHSPWNLLSSQPVPSLSSCYHVTLMTPTGYIITYGPIVLLFCLNLIVYLIVGCILTCLGTNIVSPKGSTSLQQQQQRHHDRFHASHDDNESSIKSHGLNDHTDGNQSIKFDLEWTYRRQLFAQIGLFILFTNLIVSMIFLVSWRPFSFVNHHHLSTTTHSSSSSSSFPIAEASISSETINGSIISLTTSPTSNSNSNLTESLLILTNNSTSHLIPLPSSSSSSSSSSFSTNGHSSYLPSSSTNLNAFQMDQLFYGLIYSLSSFLIASYLMILYVFRRSDVRTLLTYWFKGSNGNRRSHNQYNQYTNHRTNNNNLNGNNGLEVNRGSNWFCCCFSDSTKESSLIPKVDVIRSSNSHSSQSTDHHHLFSTTTNYHHHHHLAQALLQSAHETSTLTSSSSLVNAKLLLNNIDDTATINGKELAHGLVYEEIKSTNNDSLINLNNSSRIASIHSINKSNNSKLINNISSNCQSKQQLINHHQNHNQPKQPSLIESTSSTPLITIDSNNSSSSQVNYHLNYHEANHEVFINPKLNAIAKKFFEKNRRKQQQQQQLTNYDKDKNNFDTKDIQSITRSTSSFKSDHQQSVNHHQHPLTASIFSNRPRLSFDNGYHSNGHPKGHHHVKSSVSGSASVVGVPMSRSSGFTSEIGELISRLHPPTITSSSSNNKQSFPPSVITQPLPPPPSTLSGSIQGPTKAKSDITCWSPSSSFLAKWQGPRSNPPPLPPLPTRKELMSTGRQQPTVMVGTPRRPQLTGKDTMNNQHQDHNINDNLTSGLRVKLSNRKLPPSPSNLTKPLVKSSSSIPGALDDRDDDQAEILSVCCGSEVMSTVSVPWSCYSKRTAPPFVSTTTNANSGLGDSHVRPFNSSSTGSSSCHRYNCHSHSHSQSHSHHHHNHRSHSKRSTSKSHHRNNHCNRCWDVYFCDICDHCTSKSPPPPPTLPSNRRRDEIARGNEKEIEQSSGTKQHLTGQSSNLNLNSHSHHHSNLPKEHHRSHRHHHHHNSRIITDSFSSSLNKKDSSLPIDVDTPNDNSITVINSMVGLNSSSNVNCYPRKPASTVSSNGVERRRRRRRKSNQCPKRSSQGSTGHHHHHGSCKHLPRSTSVTEYRSCNCYNDKHQHYSSSE